MQEQTYHGIRFGMAIQLAYKNYANCKGRSRRSEYWFFHFFICLVILGYFVIMRITNIFFLVSSSDREAYITYETILLCIFCLVLLKLLQLVYGLFKILQKIRSLFIFGTCAIIVDSIFFHTVF